MTEVGFRNWHQPSLSEGPVHLQKPTLKRAGSIERIWAGEESWGESRAHGPIRQPTLQQVRVTVD
jgi:hypothetical protein